MPDELLYALILVVGVLIGARMKSARLDALEEKVRRLEVRAGLRKAE